MVGSENDLAIRFDVPSAPRVRQWQDSMRMEVPWISVWTKRLPLSESVGLAITQGGINLLQIFNLCNIRAWRWILKCLAFLLCCIIPREDVAEDHCAVAHVNHMYDEQGRLVFDQLILSNFCPSRECEVIVAWRLVKSPNMRPVYRWERGAWVTTFVDGEVTRRIVADCFRESWTQYDPELLARETYAKERRSELRKEPPTAAR